MIKKLLLFSIKIYQKTISPDHGALKKLFPGGACRFRPTCSEYCYLSVKRFGVIKGSVLGIKRVSRCHPFNEGGIDEVPKN